MKSLDAFGRPVQEFQVKTACGGYLTVCAFVLIASLLWTELQYFLEFDTRDEMLIDLNQDRKYLNISLQIHFLRLPCSMLTMNLIDTKKANVMHVVHEISKTRLSSSGDKIGLRIRDSLQTVAQSFGDISLAGTNGASIRTTHATTHLRCHSCFQSHIDEDDCCASCEDVRREFRARGWSEKPADYIFAQCAEEAYAQDPPQLDEGCKIQAMLHVRKVPASLRFGIDRHLKTSLLKLPHEKQQDFTDEARAEARVEYLQTLDFSHEMQLLSFGPDFPGLVHVLDGRKKANHTPRSSDHHLYDVHVIPTRFEEDGSLPINSHQYSVTEAMRSVDIATAQRDESSLVGLTLQYDFTPFEVRVTRGRKSLWHFFTECCAILGGIFAFTGMLDNFAHQISKSMATAGVWPDDALQLADTDRQK